MYKIFYKSLDSLSLEIRQQEAERGRTRQNEAEQAFDFMFVVVLEWDVFGLISGPF